MLVELSRTSTRRFEYERQPAYAPANQAEKAEFVFYEVTSTGRVPIPASQYREIAAAVRAEWNAVVMHEDAIYLEKCRLGTWFVDRKNLPPHLTHLTTNDMDCLLLQLVKILENTHSERTMLRCFSRALGFSVERSPSP